MSKRDNSPLSPTALDAMSKSLSLAATVLGFDIVELWSDAADGRGLHCTFVHASDELIAKHPSIIYGYYPKHDRAHLLSPMLCKFCRENETRYHWRLIRDGDLESKDPAVADWVRAHHEVKLPIKTEMAYLLDGDYQGANIFIVGLAFDIIYYKKSKIRFLSGLGYAIYVAAFDFDDVDDDGDELDRMTGRGVDDDFQEADELDKKAYLPEHPLQASALVVSNHHLPTSSSHAQLTDADADAAPDLGLGVWGKNISNAIMQSMAPETADAIITAINTSATPRANTETMSEIGLRISHHNESQHNDDSRHSNSRHNDSFHNGRLRSASQPIESAGSGKYGALTEANLAHNESTYVTPALEGTLGLGLPHSVLPSNSVPSLLPLAMAIPGVHSNHDQTHKSVEKGEGKEDDEESLDGRSESSALNAAVANIAPTWAPGAPFSFPVGEIPIKYQLMDDLTLSQLTDVSHLTDGSNANIFVGKLGSDKVIIKMIKEEVQGNPVAMHEFDLEHGMLCRISHPHIIRVLGAGRVPRRFIVLEHLGGGSLNNILSKNVSKPGLAQRLFHKPTYPFVELLKKARDMADALEYLHFHCHQGASIIHRDLKPDNVGFTSDGKLKLFDFGLSTCVRSRSKETDAYEMTGYTGSLRYMAPEVALRQPYTEKVDVYSFAIMIWQMARDRVPFKGFNKAIFMKQVVKYNDRPKLDSSWPPAFSELLSECWSRDPARRPSFTQVKSRLCMLIADEEGIGKGKQRRGKMIKSNTENPKSLAGTAPAQSTWF